ncbi:MULTISPECIES: carbohydrate ABC transporter permease [Cohnella]|uniref:ABC-type sugar transport system permease subunit n=2 Tax=Cohnella TaxID=329857 RepID=A0A3D9KNY0_9BACL|nr:sugar ABC transporter permease [Cohnella phaseoli]RED87637.1 ABC-type sugar transport system permease subunit [Cohnella phaseoli]
MNPNRSRRRAKFRYQWRSRGQAYLFMLPWMIGFCVFMAFPIGWSLYLTFQKVNLTGSGSFAYRFVGLQNFKDALLKDNEYPIQLLTFFQQMILMLPIIIVFSLLVSLMLNQKFKGRFVYRAIFFLPVVFSTGQVLTELFQQGAGNVPFLTQYGIDGYIKDNFSPSTAAMMTQLLGMMILILWSSGVQILIFIAGFQTIPKAIYEAVRIDGASPWASFWKITLPGIKPFIGLNLLYTMVDLFTFPFNPVMEQIRSNMFNVSTGYGYASALAWFYFLLIVVMIALILWFLNRTGRNKEEWT